LPLKICRSKAIRRWQVTHCEARAAVVHCDLPRLRMNRYLASCLRRLRCMQRAERRVVYILRSESNPERHYVGIASDPIARLAWHNAGPCGYTVTHRPWKLAVSIEFPTEREALRFERYLKSGSGRAFAKRHFAVP